MSAHLVPHLHGGLLGDRQPAAQPPEHNSWRWFEALDQLSIERNRRRTADAVRERKAAHMRGKRFVDEVIAVMDSQVIEQRANHLLAEESDE